MESLYLSELINVLPGLIGAWARLCHILVKGVLGGRVALKVFPLLLLLLVETMKR